METLETPQPVQPTESKSTDWTKIILAAVVGFGLLAGSAYAGYYYGTQQVQPAEELTPAVSQPTPTPEPTPTPTKPVTDPTAGWNTYTDTRFRYSVKYPEDAIVHTPDDCAKAYVPGQGSGPGPCNSLTISLDNGDNPTATFYMESWVLEKENVGVGNRVEEYINLWRDLSWQDNYYIEEETEVGGIKTKSIKGILQDVEEGDKWGFYTSVASDTIRHDIVWEDTVDKSHDAILNQILSTFRFLD